MSVRRRAITGSGAGSRLFALMLDRRRRLQRRQADHIARMLATLVCWLTLTTTPGRYVVNQIIAMCRP
jgi:hypothetical protein